MRNITNTSQDSFSPVSSDIISVIIQGPLDRGTTSQCIHSIRTHLPESELIISTWKNQSFSELPPVEKIVVSEDPGAFQDIRFNQININRQIISTQRGLEHCSRPFVLKFRADLILESPSIAFTSNRRHRTHSIFQHTPFVIGNLFTISPRRGFRLFNASDIVMFGHKADMNEYWSTPLACEENLLLTTPKLFGNHSGTTLQRCVPEQYLFLSWLRRRGIPIDLSYIDEFSPELLVTAEKYLAANFIIASTQKTGITYPARFTNSHYVQQCYTNEEIDSIITNFDNTAFWKNRILMCRLNRMMNYFCPEQIEHIAGTILYRLAPDFYQNLLSHTRQSRIKRTS